MIPFGEFAPGLAPTTAGRSAVIDNVIPRADGSYGPMSQLVVMSGATALPAAPKGGIAFPKADGTYARYMATVSDWYIIGADGSVTSIGTGHTVPDGDHESFLHFGTKLIGSNVVDGMRAYDVEAGGAIGAVSGAPKAGFIFEFGNAIVALDCDGDNRLIRNSDFNDHTSWTPGVGVSDSQPVEDGGALVAGVATSRGQALIFQREAIRVATIQASGSFFSLSLLDGQAGSVGAKSVVPVKGGACFLDTNGFKYATVAGIQDIGVDKGVSAWFLDQVDASELVNVGGAYDIFRGIVWWRYRANGDSANVYSRMIGFHTSLNKWVTATVNTSALFYSSLPGYTYDTMPDLPYDTSMDVSYDSRLLAGGEPLFAALDENYKFATFSGTPMAATLETAKADLGAAQLFNRIALVGDGTATTLQVGVADRLSDSIAWKGAVDLTASGTFPIRARGRVVQYRLSHAAGDDWSTVSGLDFVNGFGR